MKAILSLASIVFLLCGSGAPAQEPVEMAKATVPEPAVSTKRSIMLYLRPNEGMPDQGYPLRDEPIIVTESEVLMYRVGIRACDTLLQVCRPRPDGTFLNPGTPEEQKRYCGPLERASPARCTVPYRGSFK